MTLPTLEQVAREIRARTGIPIEDAVAEARIKLAFDRAHAPVVEPPAPEPPAFTWVRSDAIDGWNKRVLDRKLDPDRAAACAADRAKVDAQLQPLIAARDAAMEQIRAKIAGFEARWGEVW